jgi:hypothetical protein
MFTRTAWNIRTTIFIREIDVILGDALADGFTYDRRAVEAA